MFSVWDDFVGGRSIFEECSIKLRFKICVYEADLSFIDSKGPLDCCNNWLWVLFVSR